MLIIPPNIIKAIRTEGELAYPNECCGVLMGEVDEAGTKTVSRMETIVNARNDGEQYHRFLITPEDMMQAERSARILDLDIIGFYHSHPDHPAIPSEYDKNHALPFYSYIIVSVLQSKAEDVTSWELTADRAGFLPEEMEG